jgi:serine/threonine protein kinase
MSFVQAHHPWALAHQQAAHPQWQQYPGTDGDTIQWTQKIDEGGAGEVWLGFWPRYRAYVVGKFLREAADLDARRGFAREVRILLRNIPGFVRVYRADANGPRPYYIMEYFVNGPLVRWAGSLNRDQLKQVALDASTYFATLHRAGIAHGDIKPQNLLLGNEGRLRVADPIGCGWGCTTLFAENRGGTPGYWAPEIPKGRPIAPAADVWSFGATIHHLATGIRPIDGTAFDLRAPILRMAPEIAEIVRTCCQVDPNARPAMSDISLLLQGQSWSTIRAERQWATLALLGLGATAAVVAALDHK